MKKIYVLAIPFNSLSEDLGGFREVIRPEAVDRTLRSPRNVLGLVNHDPNRVLGARQSGTLRMRKLAHGLEGEVALPDTSYAKDLILSIERGDVAGGSFSFRPTKDGDRFFVRDGHVTREVIDMEFYDLSVVASPAYPTTTVALRSAGAEVSRHFSWYRRASDFSRRGPGSRPG